MNASVSLERILHSTPDNRNFFYPILCEEDILYMSIEALVNRERSICFPYFKSVEERRYLDIYIFDSLLEGGYKRFSFEKGYAMEEKEEQLFLEYLGKDLWVEASLYNCVVEAIKETYPEIHLEAYKDWRHSLLHIYFALHRTGPYELLFKANLDYLAVALMGMTEYDMIGSSPEKIFDIPLGMLRALNTSFGAELLENSEERKWAKYLYKKHHNLIRSAGLNKYQWRYLKEQEERDEETQKRMFRFLGKLKNDEQYYTFLRYAEQKQVVDAYYSLPQYPIGPELDESSEVCDMIEWYIEHERGIDRYLREKVEKYLSDYAYESGEYIILMPSSLCEILQEAQSQHNCLHHYVLSAAGDKTIILFMREKKREQDSLITIEVVDGVIRQAFRAYNEIPSEKERLFLEEYAKSKNLAFCYGCFDDEDDDWDDDWDDGEDE